VIHGFYRIFQFLAPMGVVQHEDMDRNNGMVKESCFGGTYTQELYIVLRYIMICTFLFCYVLHFVWLVASMITWDIERMHRLLF